MSMLTEAGIKAAIRHAPTSGRAQTIIKDSGPRGAGRLALIVRPLKTRVAAEWYAIYFRDGGRRLTKIGTYPDTTLAEAREQFRNEYAPTIIKGAEPSNRYAVRLHRKRGKFITVRELFEAYIADLKRRDKSSAYTADRVLLKRQDSVANVIGPDREARFIQPEDVIPALAEIHARGRVGMANNMRGWTHSAFAFGIKAQNDYTKQGDAVKWGIKMNPISSIPFDPDSTRPGHRYLSPSEFLAFWRWCEENQKRSDLCALLRLMMATGQRVGEIIQLGERNRIREEHMIEWEKTKNGLPHAIPLPTQATDILDKLHANKHGLYFPHRFKPERHAMLTGPNKITTIYIQETGAMPFVARDLRRTWKTLAGRAGVSKEVRDRIQNHTQSDVSSRHYDRYNYIVEKRAGMATWEAFLGDILSGKIKD